MQGVDNETVMEEILMALQAADNFGCFVQGAGMNSACVCVLVIT